MACHRSVLLLLVVFSLHCRPAAAAELIDADTVLARTARQPEIATASSSREAYPFAGSAAAIATAIDKLPQAMQAQTKQYFRVLDAAADPASQGLTPAQALARHALLQPVLALLGDAGRGAYGHD